MGASSGDASDLVELRGDHQDVLAFNFPLVGNGGSLSVGLARVPAVSVGGRTSCHLALAGCASGMWRTSGAGCPKAGGSTRG